jgi:long-chain fatty acid transport protein
MPVLLSLLFVALFAGSSFAAGFGVFTQGASGLGQANAVVAHPTGASSLYFNPALLNDVPGRQLEIGTTAILIDRKISLDSGGGEESKDGWGFPPHLYYTHQLNDKVSAGLGLFFPFGLSTEWDENYEGRYLGTFGEIVSLNFNPVVSVRVNDKLSLAGGLSAVYFDATIKRKINQAALGGPPADIDQRFEADGWGAGYNLGLLYKITEQISFGATYRSHIDIDAKGNATFANVAPALAASFPDTSGQADIRLPAQATFGLACSPSDDWTLEVGARWEDWSSTTELRVDLGNPVLGSTTDITPRNWQATWAYNIGGQYRLTPHIALNAGYLYGENAVPDATFEPLIPDTDAHLFTVGVDWTSGPWTVSGALGYETHDDRDKNNGRADPVGTTLAGGVPQSTANGNYEADIYLVGFSLGYRF